MNYGIGQGDEVITTNMTAYPTITGIKRAGAKVITVDIFDETVAGTLTIIVGGIATIYFGPQQISKVWKKK